MAYDPNAPAAAAPNSAPNSTPPSAFPEELPPRTGMRTQKPGLRHCLTLQFLHSYSLRNVSNRRTRWRRIAMSIALFVLFAMAVVDLVGMFLQLKIISGIVFAIFDFLFVWAMGWALAVIGDATGTRRVCGVPFGRFFFDVFIFICFILYAVFFVVSILTIGLIAFQGVWLGLSVLVFIFAFIASEPPESYPQGMV